MMGSRAGVGLGLAWDRSGDILSTVTREKTTSKAISWKISTFGRRDAAVSIGWFTVSLCSMRYGNQLRGMGGAEMATGVQRGRRQ